MLQPAAPSVAHPLCDAPRLPGAAAAIIVQNKDVVQLQVGYHVLEGKRVPLKKPLAILESMPAAPPAQAGSSQHQHQHGSGGGSTQAQLPSSSDGSQGLAAAGAQQEAGVAGMRVVGVLRHKVLFKNRPRALISKPAGR